MALQKRVSELPAVTTVVGTDLLIVSSNNATKRTSVQQIGAYFAANGVAGPQGPQGPAGAPGATNFSQLTNVPATFPPSAHQHAISEVVGLSAALDGKQAVGSYATLVGGKVPESQLPPIVTTWEGLTGKPSTFPPAVHSHAIADVTGLQTALDGKQIAGSYAAAVHAHGISDVTGLQTALDGKAASSHTHTIANVTGLQSALDAKATPADVTSAVASVVNAAPASLDTLKELADALGNDANFASTVTNAIAGKAAAVHTHVIADVTGLQTALDGKQASGSYAASVHTHGISDVTGLQTALDGKQAAGSYAAAVHTHGISDVTGLQTALDGKAAASHGHAIADVTGLQTALDGKQASGSYAAATHSHAIADVTGLQTALDGKAAQSHTHTAIQISDFASAVAAASPEEVVEYATPADFPATGNSSLLYVATDNARAYRWVGSQYAEVGPTSLFMQGHTHTASDIVSGTIATARLGSGATATNFLRGDSTFADPTASLTYATTAQAQDGVSTAVAMNPARTLDEIYNYMQFSMAGANVNTTGQSLWQTAFAGSMLVQVGSSSVSGGGGLLAYHRGGGSPSLAKWNGTSGNFNARYFNWTRRQRFRIRVAVLNNAVSANTTYRFLLGKTGVGTANIGALANRGVGFEIRGSNAVWLTAHNGTTRTDTNANTTLATGAIYEFVCESDGAGNATLFMDGAQIATSTGGPSTAPTDFTQQHFVVEATTTDQAQTLIEIDFPHISRP